MVISPVPEWLITKLWQISPEEISATRMAIQDKINAVVRQREADNESK